jgi:hypothetical protein
VAVSQYRTSDFEVVGGAALSLSRGTIPKPSILGLIGQLTEGSQKSSLQNGLKRRTLRASTIPWLPGGRLAIIHLGGVPAANPMDDRN